MSKARVAVGLGAVAVALATPIVMRWEGLSLSPYKDPIGLTTVCYGDTHAQMRRYTADECKALLAASIQEHGAQIVGCMDEGLPANQKAAALSFAYNVGAAKFCSSTFAKKLNARDPSACAELDRWILAGGKPLPGLVKRRADERAMCEGRA